MFSQKPFPSIALVLAILAYLGAVRIAIRQRLGVLLDEMHKLSAGEEAWVKLWKHARRQSQALMLLMPADIIFIVVAIMLILSLMCSGVRGSLTIAIDYGIIMGAAWLFCLHGLQWYSGFDPATRPRNPSLANKEVKKVVGPYCFCKKGTYKCLIFIPVAVVAVLVIVSVFVKCLLACVA